MITSRHIRPNSFWGLTKQVGPWKTTTTDLAHEANGYDSPHNQIQEVRPFQQNGSAAPTYAVTPIIQPDRIENFRGVGLQRERTGQGLGERLATLFKDLQGEQAPQFPVKTVTQGVQVDGPPDDGSSTGTSTPTSAVASLKIEDFTEIFTSIFPNQAAQGAIQNPTNVPPMQQIEAPPSIAASSADNINRVVPETPRMLSLRESMAPGGRPQREDPQLVQEVISIVQGRRSRNPLDRAAAESLNLRVRDRQASLGMERALVTVAGSTVPFNSQVHEEYIRALSTHGAFVQPPTEILEMQLDSILDPLTPEDTGIPFGFPLAEVSQGSVTSSPNGSSEGSVFNRLVGGSSSSSEGSPRPQDRANVLPTRVSRRVQEIEEREAANRTNLRVRTTRTTSVGRGLHRVGRRRSSASSRSATPSASSRNDRSSDSDFVPSARSGSS